MVVQVVVIWIVCSYLFGKAIWILYYYNWMKKKGFCHPFYHGGMFYMFYVGLTVLTKE